MRTKPRPEALPEVALTYELGVSLHELDQYLDELAADIGRTNVYTVDERVLPEVVDRLRRVYA